MGVKSGVGKKGTLWHVQGMIVTTELPDDAVRSLRLGQEDIARRMRIDFAAMMYVERLASYGLACTLAGLDYHAFGLELGSRGIERHYSQHSLEEDVKNAVGQ